MAIIKTQAKYNSTDSENLINTLIWYDDDTDPIAVLQISHDLTDHIDRYDRFARYLAEKGFIVCGNDHIGHGKTATMEKLGDFGKLGTEIRMVDDMHVLYNIMSKRYEGLPYFLLGHSMGSFLARIYAANFGYELSGLILCGTSQVDSRLSFTGDYVYTLFDLLGGEKYSNTGSEVLGKLTSKLVFKEDDDSSWLSLSRENRDEALADPYFDFPITNASAANVAKMLIKCSSDECINAIPNTLPIMLISGAKDPIGLFGRALITLCDKLEANGVNTEMILYPGLRHELLNEDDYEKIYDDIINWMFNNLFGGYS